MKSSSELISKQVFSVNAFYTKKQNETKILFFKCLKEKKSEEYFSKKLSKIWDGVDHKFMDKQLLKLKELVHSNNVEEALNIGRLKKKYDPTMDWIIEDEYFRLTPESEFQRFEQRFKVNAENIYNRSYGSIDSQGDTYINKRVETYNKDVNQVVSYFDKAGNVVRQVQLSSYLSMIHNTNLTRAGWNQTIGDSTYLDRTSFIIPYHSFSCPHCLSYQNRVLSLDEVMEKIGDTAIDSQGDLLHPNCKCTLSIYWDSSQKQTARYTEKESKEFYKLRQKVNTLTLEKSNLRTDMKIYKDLGDESSADKCRQRINAINRTIRDIKKDLPTEELRKQITAIYR